MGDGTDNTIISPAFDGRSLIVVLPAAMRFPGSPLENCHSINCRVRVISSQEAVNRRLLSRYDQRRSCVVCLKLTGLVRDSAKSFLFQAYSIPSLRLLLQ